MAWETTQGHKHRLKHCLDLGFAGIIIVGRRRANRERATPCQLDICRAELRSGRTLDLGRLFLSACQVIMGHGRGWPGPWIILRNIGASRAISRPTVRRQAEFPLNALFKIPGPPHQAARHADSISAALYDRIYATCSIARPGSRMRSPPPRTCAPPSASKSSPI